MNKKQALALLRRKRGRGRPSKKLAAKLALARKLTGLTAKGKRHLKKMGKKVAKKLVGTTRGRGRPSLAMSLKLKKARRILQNNPEVPTDIYDTTPCWNCGSSNNLGLIPCKECGGFFGDCCAVGSRCPSCLTPDGLNRPDLREGCPHYKQIGEVCRICDS